MLTVMDPVNEHTRQVVDQFSRQAVYSAKLPGHEEATRLLLLMAEGTTVSSQATPDSHAPRKPSGRMMGMDDNPYRSPPNRIEPASESAPEFKFWEHLAGLLVAAVVIATFVLAIKYSVFLFRALRFR